MSKYVSKIAGELKEIQVAGMSCCLLLPDSYHMEKERYPVIYINGEIPVEEVLAEVGKLEKVRNTGGTIDFILLSIRPRSWNDDFTPWSAPAFRKGEEPPQGKAGEYLRKLSEEIKPYMDANYRTKPDPEHTVLLGYSLGGLAAIYSLYLTDCFGWVGSLSGSLWYDDFCGFMERERPLRTDVKVYLSLGKKESQSRNPRMGKVAECTERAREILLDQLGRGHGDGDNGNDNDTDTARDSVLLEWNEGGHFHEIAKRFAKAIAWWKGFDSQEEEVHLDARKAFEKYRIG